jgi:AAHS family 4-hydroxybenzoate transporter-like MFS transporter
VAQASSFSVPEQKTVKARNVFAVIFSGTYSAGTLLLWLTYFMGLVIVYLLTSWLPTLMRDSGASMEQAAFIGALFQFGGVLSAVGVGWAMDRFNPHKVIGTFYLLAGVFAYAVGQSLGNITLLATLVLVAGMCVNGAQSAMPSLAARFYPTQGAPPGVVDARHRPLRRDSRRLDGRLAGPGLELRAGAHGAGDSGGVGHDGGGDQRHGQPRRRDLKAPLTGKIS